MFNTQENHIYRLQEECETIEDFAERTGLDPESPHTQEAHKFALDALREFVTHSHAD